MVTSAQAAARVLAEQHGAGARVLLLGGGRPRVALRRGRASSRSRSSPTVRWRWSSGYGPDVRWRDIMRVATLVRDGLPWVASNTDLTIPTPYGLAPGHGVLVRTDQRLRRRRAGRWPASRERPLMEETVRRVGGERPLMVGDRLDTDIEGAHAIGCASLLVLTGVTWLADLVAAAPDAAADVHLARPGGAVRGAPGARGDRRRRGRARRLARQRSPTAGSTVDRRAAATPTGGASAASACWRHLDETGERGRRRRHDAARTASGSLGAE